MSKLKDFHLKFLKLEDSHNLLRPGDPVRLIWERIRYSIYNSIGKETGVFSKEKSFKNNNRKNARYFNYKYICRHIFNKNPLSLLFKNYKYLFFGHPRRKKERDFKYWDIYCDPIIDHLGEKNCAYIERDWRGRHLKPAKTKNIYYLDFINTLSIIIIKVLIKVFKMKLNDEERIKIKSIEKSILDDFGVAVEIEGRAEREKIKRKTWIVIYYCLLFLIRPKVIFLVTSNVHGSLIEAAKLLRIPTIELQHGIISKYYLVLSYEGGRIKSSAPDYFFSFGEIWSNTTIMPFGKKNIIPIGFPYLEEKTKAINVMCKKEDKILFISQGTIGEKLEKLIVSYLEINTNSVEIIYKLHPEESENWRERYQDLNHLEKLGTIRVVEGNEPSLYDLMLKSKWQVGVYSTALLEGIAFGCHTYILNAPGVESVEFLSNSKSVEIINSAKDIDFNKDITPNIKYIIKKNWKNNFNKAISNIITQ